MKIQFLLRYHTQYGDNCYLSIDGATPQPMTYLNEDFWVSELDFDSKKVKSIQYQYHFQSKGQFFTSEWETERQIVLADWKARSLQVIDLWNPAGALENVFYTQVFQKNNPTDSASKSIKGDAEGVLFKVKSPMLQPDEVICLLGHGVGLRNWDSAAPLLLEPRGQWWQVRVDLSRDSLPLAYKYGIWNTKTNRFVAFESHTNRTLYHTGVQASEGQRGMILHDGFASFDRVKFKGAGVAIPVFSLRSQQSWGVGEFTDIPALSTWSQSVGLKLIQLLPINDTSATHTWVDSYPYASISAFALHPIYLNVEQVAGKAQAAMMKPYVKKAKVLNALTVVDYEAVSQLKWGAVRELYDVQKEAWAKDKNYLQYYEENKHWLAPYAVFCWMRDHEGTSDFNQWADHKIYDPKAVDALLEPKSKHTDAIGVHLFVQWHLHLQLKAATDDAHSKGLSMKGDIAIGIYRFSCDAWVAPDLYNMNKQAGAPPDDFAVKGQNWGFPTYNWERMKEDGFAWWKQRFEQLSLYFDAFRIDHILGFFRIWSIPMDAVEGILGQFIPAIPITERELYEKGIGFNYDRLCKPYIQDVVLNEVFGTDAILVRDQYLDAHRDGGYTLKPAFDTQRKVEAYFATKKPESNDEKIKGGLYDLHSNVILLDADTKVEGHGWTGAFRLDMDKTLSFKYLEPSIQQRLKDLYVNYFYRRQDEFWEREALEKLPAMKRATNMLICGEDLGMVPDCVPGVMRDLGLLSLEIQRMPKGTGAAFFHPKDAPYLSVVTPSTHDMSTLRGWWEEDPKLTQRFFNEILLQQGDAPFYCEPWINRMLLEQHFHAPAMWSIFQLQDLMGMDGAIRRENPQDERINVPANPKHYWRYRMHMGLEDLQNQVNFNREIRRMVMESGRG